MFVGHCLTTKGFTGYQRDVGDHTLYRAHVGQGSWAHKIV